MDTDVAERAVPQKAKRRINVTRNCSRPNPRNAWNISKFLFLRANVWAISSSKIKESQNHTATSFGRESRILSSAGGIVGVIGQMVRAKRHVSPHHEPRKTRCRNIQGRIDRQARLCRQSRDSLNADKTLWGEISDGLDMGNWEKGNELAAYVSRLIFRQRSSRSVSPAFRRRANAYIWQDAQSGPTCLLLDEPTNDLDVNTMRASKKLLKFRRLRLCYQHDRWFLAASPPITGIRSNSQVEYSTEIQRIRSRRKRASGSMPTSASIKIGVLAGRN